MSNSEHPCGVIFLDKPLGWSSRKAVNHVIHLFAKPEQKNRKQRPKAGHTGTLDPLATGMLPILLGDATRFTSFGLNAEKAYTVQFDLSYQTDTLDCEGKVVARYEQVMPDNNQLEEVVLSFMGLIEQIPPIYSAIRVDGKRAYALARKGEEVVMQSREVEIKHLNITHIEGSIITLDVVCSKGTYIRSLARDIGEKLGLGGCVTALRRTSSGGWPDKMMVNIEELEQQKENCIFPLQLWLRDLLQIQVDENKAKRFVQGQSITLDSDKSLKFEDETLCCVKHEDFVLGTAKFSKHMLHPERVLPTAQERMK